MGNETFYWDDLICRSVSPKFVELCMETPRLDYQPLFGKGALLGEGRPDTGEQRKSSLGDAMFVSF